MRRILHVLVEPKFAGAQRLVFDVLNKLDSSSFERVVLVGDGDSFEEFEREFNIIGVKVIKLKELKRNIGIVDIKAFWKIFKLCRKERFDILHTNSTKPGIVARIAGRIAGVKLVVHTVHGIAFHKLESPFKRFFYYVIEIFACFFGHRLIIVNKFYKKYYSLFNPKTIYNGVDFSRFLLFDEKKKPSDTVNILFVGRLDNQKSPITLLRAIKYIKDTYNMTNMRAVLVGDGDSAQECKDYATESGINSYVRFVGWADNPTSYYLAADIFCLPSAYEAFGLVFLEAGYFKLPIVATRVEGVPEVVKDGFNGILVEPGNVAQLGEALFELISNEEARIQLGENSRAQAMRFSVQDTVTKYIEVYQSNL